MGVTHLTAGRRRRFLAAHPEELAEQRSGFRGEDSRVHLRPVIETRMAQQVRHRTCHARLVVEGPESHAIDPRQKDKIPSTKGSLAG